MDDFSGAGILWMFLILFIGSSFVLGGNNSENNVIEQCRDFNKFSVDKNVYQCKLIK